MARNNVAKQGKAGERPVKSGIHRAAKRIGLEPAEARAEDLDRTDEELDVLRHVVRVAEHIFETGEEAPGLEPQVSLLRDALRSTKEDVAVLAASQANEFTPEQYAFTHVERRITLALALFDYRQEFGFPESANEVEAESAEVGS